MSKPVAQIGVPTVNEDADLLRNDTIFDTDACMAASPLVSIHMKTTAHVGIRGEAHIVDRGTENQTAAEVVKHGFVISVAGDIGNFVVIRGIEPCCVESDTDISVEEIIQTNASTPAVLPE